MITGNVFQNNQLVKTYSLHSNVGFDIYLYEYNSLANQMKKYELRHKMNDVKTKLRKVKDGFILVGDDANTNRYRLVDTVMNFNELIYSSPIKAVEKKGRKQLLFVETLNQMAQSSTDNLTNRIKRRTNSIHTYEYNADGKIVSQIWRDPTGLRTGMQTTNYRYFDANS